MFFTALKEKFELTSEIPQRLKKREKRIKGEGRKKNNKETNLMLPTPFIAR